MRKNPTPRTGFYGKILDENLKRSVGKYRFDHPTLGRYQAEIEVLFRDLGDSDGIDIPVFLAIKETLSRGVDGERAAGEIYRRLQAATCDVTSVHIKEYEPVIRPPSPEIDPKHLITREEWFA